MQRIGLMRIIRLSGEQAVADAKAIDLIVSADISDSDSDARDPAPIPGFSRNAPRSGARLPEETELRIAGVCGNAQLGAAKRDSEKRKLRVESVVVLIFGRPGSFSKVFPNS